MPNKKGNWGGRRDNQTGRPPAEGETQVDRKLSLTPRRWEQLKRVSGGNYSRGVRVLLDFWEEHTKKRA